MKICLIRRTSRSKHSLILRDTKRGAARLAEAVLFRVMTRFKCGVRCRKHDLVEVTGSRESDVDALQFVLPPHASYRDVVEPAAAAAPHAQVLPEQLVHPLLTVPFAGRFPDAYKAAVALL